MMGLEFFGRAPLNCWSVLLLKTLIPTSGSSWTGVTLIPPSWTCAVSAADSDGIL